MFCAQVQLLQTRNLHSDILHKLNGELHYQKRWKMTRFMDIYHKQPTCLPCNTHLRFYMLEFLDSLFVSFENKHFLLRVTSWSRRRYVGPPWRLHSVRFHWRARVWCVRASDHIVWPFDAGLGEIFGCLIPHILSTPVHCRSRMRVSVLKFYNSFALGSNCNVNPFVIEGISWFISQLEIRSKTKYRVLWS